MPKFISPGKPKNPDETNREKIRRIVFGRRESGLFFLLIGIFVIMFFLEPDTFFSTENMFNILRQVSIVAIIAVGQTFVMVSGGIDLSIGYSLGLCGIVIAQVLRAGYNPLIAIICGVVVSALVGFSNGIIITKLKLPPFIATLGMANIARGIIYVMTKGYSISVSDPFILFLGSGNIGPIPAMAILMVIIILFGMYLLDRTAFGTRVKAMGGNELATKLSGINVSKNKIAVYTMTGVLAGIGGVITIGRQYAANPGAGANFEMDSIAATIVGGTSLSGGQGTVLGTLLGSLLLTVIKNALILMSVNMYWQTVAVGGIIIAVCAIDVFTKRKK